MPSPTRRDRASARRPEAHARLDARCRPRLAGPRPAGRGAARRRTLARDARPSPPAGALRKWRRRAASPAFRDDARDGRPPRSSTTTARRRSTSCPRRWAAGVGLLDYDGDGWLDVYAVQGGPLPARAGPAAARGDRLFRNRGDGTFEDVTDASGIAAMPRGYGHGVAVGDFDNDGHPDLFVTRWRSYALYRNRGDGTFEDVTARCGPGRRPRLADLGGLRRPRRRRRPRPLRLPLPGLGRRAIPRVCRDPTSRRVTLDCDPRELRGRCPTTSSATTAAGSSTSPRRPGIVRHATAAAWASSPPTSTTTAGSTSSSPTTCTANYLFRNLGGFRFEEIGADVGRGRATPTGGYQAGMGVACGDLDGDGRPDLAVTNFYGESTTFFRNLGGGLFADQTAAVGLAAPSRYLLGLRHRLRSTSTTTAGSTW